MIRLYVNRKSVSYQMKVPQSGTHSKGLINNNSILDTHSVHQYQVTFHPTNAVFHPDSMPCLLLIIGFLYLI